LTCINKFSRHRTGDLPAPQQTSYGRHWKTLVVSLWRVAGSFRPSAERMVALLFDETPRSVGQRVFFFCFFLFISAKGGGLVAG